MKNKLAYSALIILFLGVIYFCTIWSKNSSKKGYRNFYISLDENQLNFNLYNTKSSPLEKETIKTLSRSYSDLIEFDKSSKYKIKISQAKHKEATEELRYFYRFVKGMSECRSDFEFYSLCKSVSGKIKADKVFKYLENQIQKNAKVPYLSFKDYFYLSYKRIMDEEYGG